MQPTTKEERQALAGKLVELCRQAGQVITALYHSGEPLHINQKADDSPVTEADHQSQHVLAEGLGRLTPAWPVLSEEQAIPDFSERRDWRRYWLVDPLDGTREFINRTGEFTINIALIEDGWPVLGIIYLPLEESAYIGIEGGGAWREDAGGRTELKVRDRSSSDQLAVLTGSRHQGRLIQACLERLRQHFIGVERVQAGSALKFCLLAEGRGDIYPRFAPCCEWDTAAGQAVLEAAGGELLGMDFLRFRYNQKESLINPHFFAVGAGNVAWRELLGGWMDEAESN